MNITKPHKRNREYEKDDTFFDNNLTSSTRELNIDSKNHQQQEQLSTRNFELHEDVFTIMFVSPIISWVRVSYLSHYRGHAIDLLN